MLGWCDDGKATGCGAIEQAIVEAGSQHEWIDLADMGQQCCARTKAVANVKT